MLIIGIDMAWGERRHDGVCVIKIIRSGARIDSYAYPKGDDALISCIKKYSDKNKTAFITIDAPIICPNPTGTRAVDRLTHRLFHREHAGCHPANSTKCPRPIRVMKKLKNLGARAGWDIKSGDIVVAEVYPHPAMVRMFRLPRIVKYKKGKISEKKKEFKRLQSLMLGCLKIQFPYINPGIETLQLLKTEWSKSVEDKTDALFCALIGLWHWYYRGKRSEIIGDLENGFILLPEDLRENSSPRLSQ